MTDTILEYVPKIDKKLEKVVRAVLGVKVKSLERIRQGEVNYVYKVKIESQTVLVRVARYKDWPDIGKLTWIFEKLTEKGIAHQKVLFSDISSEYFKFGFTIYEWLDGKDGMTLIKEGQLSRKEAVVRIAQILQKIHRISIDGFGMFNHKGEGKYKTWEESLFSFFEDPKYKRAVKVGVYGKGSLEKGILAMEELIKNLDFKPKSILTHQDPTPENAIFDKDEITLIDWDNAKGSVWIEDLAWITFWMGKKAQKWFLEAYKSNDPLDLIEKVEKVIHIRLAITLLPYYLYSTKDYKNARKMKGRLRSLISDRKDLLAVYEKCRTSMC